MESVLIVIPARYSSSRFPGKVLYPINGRPMLQYVWEAASKVKLTGVEVVIATDDERVKQTAQGFGARVVMTSPNCSSGTDRCAELAKKKPEIDWVINLQADEPLITCEVIESFIKGMLRDQPQMASLYTQLQGNAEDPNVVKVVLDEDSFAVYFSRSPIPYFRTGHPQYWQHIGIYGYKRQFLLEFSSWGQGCLEKIEGLEQLRAIEKGVKIKMFYTDYQAIGVDVLEDVKKVEERLGGSYA